MGKDGVMEDELLNLLAVAFRRKGMLFPETEEEVKAAKEELARLEAAGELPPLPESLKEPPWHLLEKKMAQDWPGHMIRTDADFQEFVAKLVSNIRVMAKRQQEDEDADTLHGFADELEGGTLEYVTVASVAYTEAQSRQAESKGAPFDMRIRDIYKQLKAQGDSVNRILQIVEGLAQRRR